MGHPDLYESLILGLELVRYRVLHHDDFSVKYSGGPMHGSGGCTLLSLLILDEDKRHIRYISRVMCAAPLSESLERWKGPVSRALLAFNSMVTEVSNNLRNLVEMVLLAMCAHGDTDRLILDTKSWTQLSLKYQPFCKYGVNARLPFMRELDTTFGVLARCKVEEMMTKKRNEGYTVEKELNLVDIDDLKPLVSDLPKEVKRIYIFWDAVPPKCCKANYSLSVRLRRRILTEQHSWIIRSWET